MAPRMPLRTPTVIRRYVDPPTEGPAVDALIANPQAVLDGLTKVEPSPAVRAPIAVELPKSIREEAARALDAFDKGNRYAYRGEKPVRITADLPKGLYKALKVHSAETGQDIRVLVIRGLEALGIVEP